MADSSLSFDILAIDKASEVFKKVGENAEGMSSSMSKFGKIAAAGVAAAATSAIALVTTVAKIGFDEYKENQTAVAQLNSVIKSTGGVAGTTVDQMQKLADTIQNYSGQTHESIEASESLLLGFSNIHDAAGKNNDILSQATKVTADLAARMGGDASSYAVKLGKALNDPTQGLSALTRMGIQFTAAQKKQIDAMQASGNVVGAQQMILAALTTRYGGAAKAAGETLPGELARGREAFEDVAASIVAKLMPSITSLVGVITDKILPAMGRIYDTEGPMVAKVFTAIGDVISTYVVPVFDSLGGFIQKHETLFKALGVAVGAMTIGFGALGAEMLITAGISKAFAAVQSVVDAVLEANPIGVVVLALAGLAAGFDYAYHHSETFRDIVQNVMSKVSAAFQVFSDAVKTVFDFVTQRWQLILAVVLGPMGLAIDVLVDHWNTFRDVVSDVWKVVSAGITDAWHVIEPILDTMKKTIDDTVGAVGKVAGAASKVGGIVGKGAKLLGFDQGGVVPGSKGSPTLAVVHGGEQVLPADALTNTISPPGLPRGRAGSGTAGGITINLNGPIVGGSQSDARNLAAFLAQEMAQQFQSQQRRNGTSILIPQGVTG